MTGLDFAAARLSPVNGAGGWLARLPGAVVWVPGGSDRSQQFMSSCVESAGARELLARIGRSIADPSAKQWPPFCVVADRDDELVVLVHGPIDVTVDSGPGTAVLRGGDDTGAWVSRSVRAPRSVTSGAVPFAAQGAEVADGGTALVNLALGVLRADGFTLTMASGEGSGDEHTGDQHAVSTGTGASDAGASDAEGSDVGGPGTGGPGAVGASTGEEPLDVARDLSLGQAAPVQLGDEATSFDYQGAPTQAPAMDADASPQGAAEGREASSAAPRGGVRARLGWARSAVAARPGAEDATLVEGPGLGAVTIIDAPGGGNGERRGQGAAAGAGVAVTVRGSYCPRGHFNDPRAQSCRRCGARIAHDAPQVDGPRPPLGSLNWDDGEVSALGQGAVVGRDVAGDEAVSAGALVAVVPRGVNDSMSRVHAELRAIDWDVTVLDRGSTNGTFIWDEGARAWQRLVPGEEQLVGPGTVLAFGERTATFEL